MLHALVLSVALLSAGASGDLKGEAAIERGKTFLAAAKVGGQPKLLGLSKVPIASLAGTPGWNLEYGGAGNTYTILMQRSDGGVVAFWTNQGGEACAGAGLDGGPLADSAMANRGREVLRLAGLNLDRLSAPRAVKVDRRSGSTYDALWFDLLVDGRRVVQESRFFGCGICWDRETGVLHEISAIDPVPVVDRSKQTVDADRAGRLLRKCFDESVAAVQPKGPKSVLLSLGKPEAIYYTSVNGPFVPAWLVKAELKHPAAARMAPSARPQWVVVDAVTGKVLRPFNIPRVGSRSTPAFIKDGPVFRSRR
jgi:hypothetical protein